MKEFGWTIEYTLSLSYPVFFDLFGLIRRVRLDNAIDSFYIPYGAAKYGKSLSKALFDGRGDFVIREERKPVPITKSAYRRAYKQMDEIIKSRNQALVDAAKGC